MPEERDDQRQADGRLGRRHRHHEEHDHLAVDGVSWRILLDDLETAYRQVERGESIRLAAVGTPWSTWARALVEHAGRADFSTDLAVWQRALAGGEVTKMSPASTAALNIDDDSRGTSSVSTRSAASPRRAAGGASSAVRTLLSASVASIAVMSRGRVEQDASHRAGDRCHPGGAGRRR